MFKLFQAAMCYVVIFWDEGGEGGFFGVANEDKRQRIPFIRLTQGEKQSCNTLKISYIRFKRVPTNEVYRYIGIYDAAIGFFTNHFLLKQ